MTKPALLMLHGWGFDASLWNGLCAALPEYEIIRADRGYFGQSAAIVTPALAVGHSLGAMLLAAELPAEIPLVAINGFDCFAGAVAPRILARMRQRFAIAPETVLTEFRGRCGAGPHAGPLDHDRLAADLGLLATMDARASNGRRVLVLHGGEDPILPPPMRDAVFAGAPRITHPEAGHLLPRTHPVWCAAQIRTLCP